MRSHSISSVRSAALLTAALAALAAGAGATPAIAATAIGGELNAVANAELRGLTPAGHDHDSWTGGAFRDLATSVTASVQFGAESVATHGAAAATWSSANDGSVTFTDYGWDFDAPTDADAESNLTANRGGADWSYTFTALGDGAFTMDYAVAGAGQLFGLHGWEIGFTGTGTGGPTFQDFDPTASGTFVGQLISGQQYTVTLTGDPNISGAGVFSGAVSGRFDWRITDGTTSAAPEPAAWALLLFGFGMTCALVRRRRVAA